MVPCSRMQSTRRNPRSLGKGARPRHRHVRLRHRVRRFGCAYPFVLRVQRGDRATDADISATMLMYLFGVVLTLFLSGSLSDAAGRRPLAAASLLLAMLGCFLFLRAADPTIVLVARAVQGVSCGLAMSAVSALVVDSAVGRYEGFGLAVAGCGALLG
ncbi:MAG: MFS transporter, partial [Eggerthellaceae bacterium]